MTEHEAYVAFNMVPDFGSVKLAALVGEHGSAAAAWEHFPRKEDWRGEPVDWRTEIARARRMHVAIVTCADELYPDSLNDLPSKPLALYVVGDPEALSMPGVAVVGTRMPTLYGTDMAEKFSTGIAKGGYSIISGLAAGIDAEAHKGALAAGGVTIGVLGGALDRFFPEENRELGRRIAASGGAVVSEYPFGFPPGRRTFPQRNRIVAALARAVLAVEAPMQSGTLITCEFARQLGRKVLAIPANLDSRHSAGCWKLIREGATMVVSVGDFLQKVKCGTDAQGGAQTQAKGKDGRKGARGMPETARPKTCRETAKAAGHAAVKPELTIEEAAVLRMIPSAGITLDRLAFASRLPADAVGKATMSLRLKGLLRFIPGNRVAPAK